MTIGKTIAYLRDVYSISQRELAKKIGMSKSVLNRVEQDSRPLRVDELVKIADYFDLSTDYILGRKEVSTILFTQRNIIRCGSWHHGGAYIRDNPRFLPKE